MEETTQGICLQAIPYLNNGRILKVFTPEEGLLTVMAKKKSLVSLAPFCIGEWVIKKGRGEIGTLVDGSTTDSLLELRTSYLALTAAGSIARDLLSTQMPGKNSPALYQLACSYLKRSAQFPNPTILSSSFRMKLLLHEGLLALREECAVCGAKGFCLMRGETVCAAHASAPYSSFSKEEWEALFQLTFTRQFSLLQTVTLSPALQREIDVLFEGLC